MINTIAPGRIVVVNQTRAIGEQTTVYTVTVQGLTLCSEDRARLTLVTNDQQAARDYQLVLSRFVGAVDENARASIREALGVINCECVA